MSLLETWFNILLYNSHGTQLVSLIFNAHLASTGSSEESRLLVEYEYASMGFTYCLMIKQREGSDPSGIRRIFAIGYCIVGRLRQICNRIDG